MSPAQRRIAVGLPPELRESDVHEVGFLKQAMCGTRDAAMCNVQEGICLHSHELSTFCDADHAGCIRRRKLIALSSAETKLNGLTLAASESLGERSFAMDLGVKRGLSVSADATAGATISSRRGIGRVKHLATCSYGCARQRGEGRNQDQESPYVGERIRHLDQSSTIIHYLEDDRDH